MKVYIVHSVIPSYFSSAEKALKHAWGTSAEPSKAGDTAARDWYINCGKRALQTNGIIKPDSALSPFPKVTVEEVK